MVEISVETKMMVELLNQLNNSIFEKVRLCVQKYSLMVETMSKDKAPTDLGNLKTSITQNLYIYATEIVGQVGTNLDYTFWQHEGFKAHWIPFYNAPSYTPKDGVKNYELLQWAKRHGFDVEGKNGGKPMMGLYVHGTAHPFIQESFNFYQDKFKAEIENILQEGLRELNGD
jgi:hypothetical protein